MQYHNAVVVEETAIQALQDTANAYAVVYAQIVYYAPHLVSVQIKEK